MVAYGGYGANFGHIDLFCPKCNILVEMSIEARVGGPRTPVMGTAIDPEDTHYNITRYDVALCSRCKGPFLIQSTDYEVPGEVLAQGEQITLYPAERTPLLLGMPPVIARAFEQAARAFQTGIYEACAIMSRKCLDGICAEFNASGKNLKEKLANLALRNVIDGKLHRWADQLRIVGNDAAHDLSLVIDRDDARDALEFVEVILLYLFTLNKRFDEFTLRHNAKNRNPNQA